MSAGSSRNKTIGEINITPLTDVFLVLLVVVIIAAPALSSMQQGIATPEVNAAVALKNTWLVAHVDSGGAVFIEGSQVELANLQAFLAARAETLPEKVIVIRGDRNAQSGVILNVLRAAEAAGFDDGFIAGQLTRIDAGQDAR